MPRRSLPLPARAAAIAALLALAGCHYVSNPVVGFGGSIANTHTFARNPNLPPGTDENTLHAEGRDTAMQPLLPEPGNIWPGPPPPMPTLTDVEQQQNVQPLPPIENPPATPAPRPAPSAPPVINTPTGPRISNGPVGVPGGASTATNPAQGGQDIIVPNGNGTSTVISPDGSVRTIPTPR